MARQVTMACRLVCSMTEPTPQSTLRVCTTVPMHLDSAQSCAAAQRSRSRDVAQPEHDVMVHCCLSTVFAVVVCDLYGVSWNPPL